MVNVGLAFELYSFLFWFGGLGYSRAVTWGWILLADLGLIPFGAFTPDACSIIRLYDLNVNYKIWSNLY